MRRSQSDPEHAEAVARRLALLGAELSALRGDDMPTRLRAQEGASQVEVPAMVTVPVPGRHAHRRNDSRLAGLRGRWTRVPGLGPAHVAVVATIAAVAVGLAAWLVVSSRAEPTQVAQLRPVGQPLVNMPSGSPSPATQAPASQAPGSTDEVTVDVAGKVRRPGIVVLSVGSRVHDAVRAAGGARRGVDLTSLNLARVLVDGEQILVGVAAPAGVLGALGDPGTPTPGGGLVNINTATQPELETLPGVGPVTATAIISWRTEHGAFSAVEELVEVDGIGEATLAKLAPLVTI